MIPDPHDLARFLDAQAPVIDQVRAELAAGAKRTHWMWFVFPQVQGLGSRPMARRYALAGLDEARAWLAHPVLGPRLEDLTRLVLSAPADRQAHDIFGSPDDHKFRSSMTLFARAAPEAPVFRDALDRFFGGAEDPRTLEILQGSGPDA
jgi:uncharacterized protein (DUF1810 family)